MVDNNLAAPCGLYCGACRQYLLKKKDMLELRGFKQGCDGCRIRFKKCTFFRKNCSKLWKKEVEFCHECEEFPCDNFDRLENIYLERYSVDMIGNLKRIKEIGFESWLHEQRELYTCRECGGEICLHDAECYDCGYNINPNKK
jgi:hypothetical protein